MADDVKVQDLGKGVSRCVEHDFIFDSDVEKCPRCEATEKEPETMRSILREIRDRMPVLCLPGCRTRRYPVETGPDVIENKHADCCPVDAMSPMLPVTDLRTRPVAREGE